ncbi:TfoX/Sxy family protein [Actinoplanes sp. NPDC024001]|uniref:TfoX/Sxy family protein n=1 Tax=Actinoplanes sp. NPDC024001 TaxID=3154598 RepID=UPI0033D69082
MAYDEKLATRVRELAGDRPDMTQVRMFGGLAWLINGNMAVVVRGKGGLLVRVDPADHDDLLAEDGADTMVMRGRPMRGWLTVTAPACDDPATLATWVHRGVDYAATLPPK